MNQRHLNKPDSKKRAEFCALLPGSLHDLVVVQLYVKPILPEEGIQV
jgi:hypothetical protein